MKIKKEYDLFKKIRHSKEGLSAKETFIDAIKKTWFFHTYLFFSLLSGISLSVITGIPYFALIKIVGYSISYGIVYGISHLHSNKTKELYKCKSDLELQILVNELSNLEVKTSRDLLKEAKINQIDYKIKYEDGDKVPRLVEYKYIDVPLSNGYEETLLQEHKYGDKDYELSVNNPVKKMEFKLAKQGI